MTIDTGPCYNGADLKMRDCPKMPLFEFRCDDCRLKNTLLVFSWSRNADRVCRGCNGSNLTRLVSRFAQGRSWGESLGWAPGGETLTDVNEDDPRSIDRFMGRIKDEMGGQVTSDFEEMRRELRPGPDSAGNGRGD